MLRVATYFLVLMMFNSASWSQSRMTPAPSAVARKAISQIISRLPGAAPVGLPSLAPGANGIPYNGGPILDDANGVNAYYIWYGDWSHDRAAQKVLVNLITHIGGSANFNINATYYSVEPNPNGTGTVKDRVINAVHYQGAVDDAYSQGSVLTDDLVYAAVAHSILIGALPADPNGVYFLLTSADVTETSGYCTSYCAWHTSSVAAPFPLVNGVDIKFAFVGNPATLCAYTCIYDFQTPLSGSVGADGMADSIVHELEESVTDPDLNAWVDVATYTENADMCAYIYGSAYHSGYATDPYPPNMKFGGVPYLIQENWLNANGGYCTLKWDD